MVTEEESALVQYLDTVRTIYSNLLQMPINFGYVIAAYIFNSCLTENKFIFSWANVATNSTMKYFHILFFLYFKYANYIQGRVYIHIHAFIMQINRIIDIQRF